MRDLKQFLQEHREDDSLERELMDASPIALPDADDVAFEPLTKENAHMDLPTTPLGEIAELIREAQRSIRLANFHFEDASLDEANDMLAEARLRVDVLRGDGQ